LFETTLGNSLGNATQLLPKGALALPTIKLTQLAIERFKPPMSGRIEYWDSQLPGFGLRISSPRPGKPKETAQTYQVLCRVKDNGAASSSA